MDRFDPSETLHIDTAAALEFVVAFSRLEFAAKATGYFVKPKADEIINASVDWSLLARVLADRFDRMLSQDTQLFESFQRLQAEPPMKQVIDGGVLRFVSSARQKLRNAELAMLDIRRIRNNLFHGGKGFIIGDADRDNALIRMGTRIIYKLVECDADLASCFADRH